MWQERRVVCTESVLAFSHVSEEKVLDAIPLVEILGVQDMGGLGTADLDDEAGRILLEICVTEENFFSTILVDQSDASLDDKQKCRQVFDTIDIDRTGSCSRNELTFFLKRLSYKPEEIDNFIRLADSDRNGEVYFFSGQSSRVSQLSRTAPLFSRGNFI